MGGTSTQLVEKRDHMKSSLLTVAYIFHLTGTEVFPSIDRDGSDKCVEVGAQNLVETRRLTQDSEWVSGRNGWTDLTSKFMTVW